LYLQLESSLSIVEISKGIAKFAAGAYIGTLEAPEQMAVFLYYLNVSVLPVLQV